MNNSRDEQDILVGKSGITAISYNSCTREECYALYGLTKTLTERLFSLFWCFVVKCAEDRMLLCLDIVMCYCDLLLCFVLRFDLTSLFFVILFHAFVTI